MLSTEIVLSAALAIARSSKPFRSRSLAITAKPAASAKFDVIAVIVGGLAWGILGHFHESLFGVAPL